jgi:TolB-like protein
MNPTRTLIAGLCLLLSGLAPAPAQEIEQELTELAAKLATLTAANGKKKVTVLDFTDLQGNASELGKYVAEELTVNLVMVKTNFAVLDRANLRKILAEHKLTATGLVDPENAKKLGQFAGVDALILGTIIPKGQKTAVTAKIITTDTAEIVGAGKAEFTTDETVKHLESRPAVDQPAAEETGKAKPKVIKTFGDLRVEVMSLKIVNQREYRLVVQLTNQHPKRSLWVAAQTAYYGEMTGVVTDSAGNQFHSHLHQVAGIQCSALDQGYIVRATEIKSNETLIVTYTIGDPMRMPQSGPCEVQLGFLISENFRGNSGLAKSHQLLAKIESE